MNLKRKPIYELLPAIIRMQDYEKGRPLEAMLTVFQQQLDDLQGDLEQLYKNWFIETCPPWVIPYIADLLGISNMGSQKEVLARLRPYVGNALRLRRGKGTLNSLEKAVRAVSGWGVMAVPYYKEVACTHNLNHYSVRHTGTLDLRNQGQLRNIGKPFDLTSHLPDLRKPMQGKSRHLEVHPHSARYHPERLGIYLWRQMVQPCFKVQARPLDNRLDRYTFHPGGIDIPLFNRGEGAASLTYRYDCPGQVPGPVDRIWLASALAHYKQVQREGSLEQRDQAENPLPFDIFLDDAPVPATRIGIDDLSDASGWSPTMERALPQDTDCVVDPNNGRLLLAPDLNPARVMVTYMRAIAGPVGAGSYDRRNNHQVAQQQWYCVVGQRLAHDPNAEVPHFNNLHDAFQAWRDAGSKGLIRILDNGLYQGPSNLTFSGREHLIVEAANGMHPCIVWELHLTLEQASATLALHGLMIDGSLHLTGSSDTGTDCMLHVSHCTLIPRKDTPSITIYSESHRKLAAQTPVPHLGMVGIAMETVAASLLAQHFAAMDPVILRMEVVMKHCITGRLEMLSEIAGITLDTCIVDGAGHEDAIRGVETDGHIAKLEQVNQMLQGRIPPVYTIGNLRHTTTLGQVTFHEVERALGCIFRDPLMVQQRFGGVIQYSYLPYTASRIQDTPFCQPKATIDRHIEAEKKAGAGVPKAVIEARIKDAVHEALRRIRPRFVATRYGASGYCQLSADACEEIAKGSEDGAEMGVFHDLQESQIMANLHTVLDDFVHFGLEPDLHFET